MVPDGADIDKNDHVALVGSCARCSEITPTTKNESKWIEHCRALRDWMSNHQGKHPSQHSEDTEEARLGRWYSCQKRCYVGSERGNLNSEKIRQLEEIPQWASWALASIEHVTWSSLFGSLKKF